MSDLSQLVRQRKRSPWLEALPRALTRDGVVFAQHVREGRLQRGLAAIVGLSSILSALEVTYEHYRGSYSRRVMYSPVLLSSTLVGAGLGATGSRRVARTVLPLVSLGTVGNGLLGFYFHVRGVARKPGGWRLPLMNMNMGPPVFAPLLLAIPAYLGLVASFMRRGDDPRDRFLGRWGRPRSAWLGWLPRRARKGVVTLDHELREGRFQQHLAAATSLFSLLCGAEAYYSHYKNGYKYKMQWTPVVIAPLLSLAAAATVVDRRPARALLPLASALAAVDGAIGFFFHARGVTRRPGGTKHLIYNVLYGPPIFAPLLLGACGLLGGLTSLLRRERASGRRR
ncbi:MAG TPA: hypothetical protein VIA18_04295 [Polyangia bacterium]|nr:hypothetical protein [Polyangia bacterium]